MTCTLITKWGQFFQFSGFSPGIAKPSFSSCLGGYKKIKSLSLSLLQLTSLKRPLVVIHDLFDKSIMDISWWVKTLWAVTFCSLSYSKSTALTSDIWLQISFLMSQCVDAFLPAPFSVCIQVFCVGLLNITGGDKCLSLICMCVSGHWRVWGCWFVRWMAQSPIWTSPWMNWETRWMKRRR